MRPNAEVTIEQTELGLHVVATSIESAPAPGTRLGLGTKRALGGTSDSQCGSGWCARYDNGFDTASGPTFRHASAATLKLSGSTPYKTYVHAALTYDDPADEGLGSNPTQVYYWSYASSSCATDNQVNGSAVTCQSPYFAASNHDWLNHKTRNNAVSGHQFDYGSNGSIDGDCSGCIDLSYSI